MIGSLSESDSSLHGRFIHKMTCGRGIGSSCTLRTNRDTRGSCIKEIHEKYSRRPETNFWIRANGQSTIGCKTNLCTSTCCFWICASTATATCRHVASSCNRYKHITGYSSGSFRHNSVIGAHARSGNQVWNMLKNITKAYYLKGWSMCHPRISCRCSNLWSLKTEIRHWDGMK